MKIKYIIYSIIIILSISGFWTIEKLPTILGVTSVISICFVGLFLLIWIIENWDKKI